MLRTFKCCKNKEFPNFFCVKCANVFHPSCLDRLNDIVKIGGYKVYCSPQCRSEEVECEEREKGYIEEIEKLRKDLADKDKHIKRLQRNSTVFDDIAAEAEEKLVADIKERDNTINSLKEVIQILKSNEENLQHKLEQFENLEIDLRKDLENQRALIGNMVDTIEILEKTNQNSVLNNEIMKLSSINKKLKKEIETVSEDYQNTKKYLEDLKLSNTEMIQTIRTLEQNILTYENELLKFKNSDIDSLHNLKATNSVLNPKLVLIGDENNVRGCLNLLKYNTGLRYDTNAQFRPRMLFEEVMRLAVHYCKTMTNKDYLIMFVGNENALRGSRITTDELNLLSTVAEKTNLIVVGSCFAADREILNRLINKNNQLIRNHLNRPNHVIRAEYVSLDCFMHWSERTYYGKPSYSTKMLLCKFISDLIVNIESGNCIGQCRINNSQNLVAYSDQDQTVSERREDLTATRPSTEHFLA